MSHTLYASFATTSDAERAAGALLDHGLRAEDVSFIANESYRPPNDAVVVDSPQGAVVYTDTVDVDAVKESNEAEHAAKAGISTTTPTSISVRSGSGLPTTTTSATDACSISLLATLTVSPVAVMC